MLDFGKPSQLNGLSISLIVALIVSCAYIAVLITQNGWC